MPLSGENKLQLLKNPSLGGVSRLGGSSSPGAILDVSAPADFEIGMVPEPVTGDPLSYADDATLTDPNQDLHEIEREAPVVPEFEFDPEEAEAALYRVCREAYDAAVAINQPIKARWRMYRAMGDGQPPMDQPNDVLVELGMWIALLERFSDVMASMELSALIPDPSEYDCFEIVPKDSWYGLERYGEAVTNVLRNKLKQMAPETANGFLDVLNDLLADKRKFGNCVAVVTHEILSEPEEGDPMDGIIQGPNVKPINMMNVWSERNDVTSLAETGTCIYDPVNPDDIYTMDFVNLDKVLERSKPEPLRMEDDNSYTANSADEQSRNQWYTVQPTMDMFRRVIRFTRFPYWKMRQELGIVEADHTPEEIEAINLGILAALAPKFGFDPGTCRPNQWWDLEWIDEVMVKAHPVKLALPVGKGPLIHFKMFPKPGQLWGDGIWDKAQWDERFYNMMRRAIIKIVGFASEPPFEWAPDQYDADFVEMFGDQLRLEPGQQLKRRMGSDLDKPGIKVVELNERALPLIREEVAALFGEIRLTTGVTEQLEGTATDTLATVNANNMQQSMSVMNWHIRRAEHGLLKEIIQRMYVVMHQALQFLQVAEKVSVSDDGLGLMQLEIRPEDVIALELVDVRMTGSTSPANKASQLENFNDFVNTWLQTGALDIMGCIKAQANMLGITGAQSLIFNADPNAAAMIADHNFRAFGAGGLSMLSPLQQQSLGIAPMPQAQMPGPNGPQSSQPGQGGKSAGPAQPAPPSNPAGNAGAMMQGMAA